MSIRYQKSRLLGRMFRGAYEGGGTGETSSEGLGAAGSGWGGFSAGDTAQFGTPDAPAGVSVGGGSSGGKPGESNMAQAASQQNLTPLSDRPDTRDQTGWNDANPTQTVGQIESAQKVGDILSWGLPMAASALVPGYGLAMTIGKSGAKLMNGVPVTDVVADVLPGYINGKINQATGGLYGNVAKYGGILNSLTGSPQVPNIGREVVSGIIGRPSGGNYGTAVPATSVASEGNGESNVAQQNTPAPAAQPAPTPQADVNYASLGIDSAGWTRAGKNYLEKRDVMV